MAEAIEAVEGVLKHQAQGLATNRPRVRVVSGPAVDLNSLQAADYESGIFGFKTYVYAPGSARMFVYLYSIEGGHLLSITEASRLGQLRTGAATGVATRYMARQDSAVVGVLGSGYQARTQLEAVCTVRPVARALVYSPTAEHRHDYAEEMSSYLGIEVTPLASPGAVVDGADILLVITNSATPVFEGEWVRPGTHIAAAGGADVYVRELDDTTLQRADLVVADDIANGRIECGEFIQAASRGVILWEGLRELWQVVGGEISGRTAPEDITLFKSLGMALWDIAAAKAVYDKATARGIGTHLP